VCEVLAQSLGAQVFRQSAEREKSKYLKAALGICGEPLVGQALTLLLRVSGYNVRFLLAQSFGEPQALKDVRLLVLAPTPELSTERRNALVSSLEETSEARNMPVLELVTSVEARREEAGNESWHESWHDSFPGLVGPEIWSCGSKQPGCATTRLWAQGMETQPPRR
jgi:hypothetical protein